MQKFMTWDQETLMRTLHSLGVCMGKTKAFALFACSRSFEYIKGELVVLDKLYWKLDDALPDDSDLEVFELLEYKEKAKLVIQQFNELYAVEVSDDQYKLICSQLDPRFLINA
jgi:hypothetical protein